MTLKIGPRSPKSNQLVPPSQQCICASLVKIRPLVQKIMCGNEATRTPTQTPTGSAPKTICPPPPFRLGGHNSRLLPGKADAVKEGKGSKDKKQKRVLNDYLHNLHLKFFSETGCVISLATFCRYRPYHICLVNFMSRSTFLCPKHQNFCLKLWALKLLKVNSCTSPDKFIEIFPDEAQLETVLSKISENTVKFQEWKRVKINVEMERRE